MSIQSIFFFFFNDTATTEIYTLSLHDALPISTPAEIEEAERKDAGRRELGVRLEEAVTQPSVTVDGVHIALRGNVDLPEEVAPAKAHGAEGVGLLRTEF